MQIRRVLALKGPNIWANCPVIEAWVDLGRYEALPTHELPGFNERLVHWLPDMIEHRCSVGERGGFFQRLRAGTWLGHVLEHVTLELESQAYLPVTFGRARETSEPGVYKVAVQCHESSFARACLTTGRELILAAAEGREFDVGAELSKLRDLAERLCLGPSTQAIVAAARTRKIPALRLSEGNLVQLGYGKRQRRIWTAETDSTSAIGEAIAQDKELTRKLLAAVGIPVPQGRVVTSPEDACAAAEELGAPIVVKPRNANHGRGVSIALDERAAIRTAYEYAARVDGGVLVETFVPGTQYRVLVVGDRAVAASAGEADSVVGDGVHSVEQLVERANQDPARGDASAQALSTLHVDPIARDLLERQGLTPESIPAPGRTVLLRYNGDLTIDVTDSMHPDVANQCVLAARTVGLDIAGIDLILDDIRQPLARDVGAVIEINASPSLLMHIKPSVGEPRPVGQAIVDHMFRADENGRIDLVSVSGTNGKTLVAGLVAEMLHAAGKTVGRADSTGIHVADRRLAQGECSDAASARRVLSNPFVDAAVLEVAEWSVLEEGLGFDGCSVAVVTNLGSLDHLGRTYVDEVLQTKAVRAPVDVVSSNGHAVLSADDPEVVAMARSCRGKVLFFARSRACPGLSEHVALGGRAVLRDHDEIALFEGDRRRALLDLAAFDCPLFGLPDFLIDGALAACAAGVALGLPDDVIRDGFARSVNRGGIALLERAEARVLVTPSHNASALRAWLSWMQGRVAFRPSAALVECSSDWRPVDAEKLGVLLGAAFPIVHVAADAKTPETAANKLIETLQPAGRMTPLGQSFADAADEVVKGLRGSDGLFIQCATIGSHRDVVSRLADRGMRRSKLLGLASVGSCR